MYGRRSKCLTFLRQDRKEGTTGRKDIRRNASLHVLQQTFLHIDRIRNVEDANIRVCAMELLQHLLCHQGKPFGSPVLIDELYFFGGAGAWRAYNRSAGI